MAMSDIAKLAADAYKGSVEKYSVRQSQDLIREALIEANGGETTFNYKSMRGSKGAEVFALLEELLGATTWDALVADPAFQALIDSRNVALGDSPIFRIEDEDLFVVNRVAEGTQGLRRQRIPGVRDVEVPTVLRAVKIYEELNRILSGRVDFNHMVDRVAASFRNQIWNDIFAAWDNVTAAQIGGTAYFPAAGTYDEDALLDVIAHVEAAAGGKTATILGTNKALRNLVPAIIGAQAEADVYNQGYLGKFYGTNVVSMPQMHKAGTTTFALPDNVLTIVAGDQKPIKLVYEGDPLIIPGNPLDNADLTQEYLYGERYGVAVAVASNGGIGRYEMTP